MHTEKGKEARVATYVDLIGGEGCELPPPSLKGNPAKAYIYDIRLPNIPSR